MDYRKPYTNEEMLKNNPFRYYSKADLILLWDDYQFFSANGFLEPGCNLERIATELKADGLVPLINLSIMLMTVLSVKWYDDAMNQMK